jgi:hypothetical protein
VVFQFEKQFLHLKIVDIQLKDESVVFHRRTCHFSTSKDVPNNKIHINQENTVTRPNTKANENGLQIYMPYLDYLFYTTCVSVDMRK